MSLSKKSHVARQPTGTVTFLFTDIEGSTMLWERHPDEMQVALARHDEILRHAIEAHSGYVFKTVGDAFCAAFATAPDALTAALAAQRALHTEAWGKTLIKVRMGLHTGMAEERAGDYFGPTVNRVARLHSVGHGGQILLSQATQELVHDQLPGPVALRDVGERRLKDLIRPEHIFQVIASDLPADFPPLKTLDYRPNNLPAQTTPFIGRETELAAARKELLRPEVRLLTLTGPGGTGKTRLSLQVAADMLDDFEHVTQAAPEVSDLLSVAPGLKVLVTSRMLLRVYGERDYLVPPLDLPDPKLLPPLERLSGSGVTGAEATTLTCNGCGVFFDFCGEWGYTNVLREGFV